MNLDEQFFIDRVHGTGAAGGAQRAPKTGEAGASEFRALLEKLEAMARKDDVATPAGDGDDGSPQALDALQEDLRKADDEFVTAMELRRRLEAAYRRLEP